MRAIIVRHYKTVGNANNRIIGWSESPPVAGWQRDMKHVDKMLHAASIHFEAVYTSQLHRARSTGLFYAQSRGISKIRCSKALNEVNYGVLNTKSKKWVEKNIPGHKKDPDLVYPEGESFRQMQKRSVRFIKSIAEINRDKTVLIVVHAGIIRGLICHFMGLDYGSNLKRKITHRYIGDFTFEGPICIRYDELGTYSGFVKSKIIEIPYYRTELQST
jgi:alpha-ribazole phosphatase